MKNIGVFVRLAAIVLALVSACSVPPVDFTPSEDAGGNDPPPDMSGPPMLVVSTTAITVDEAATATFTVRLSAPPPNAVLVSIDSEDDNRLGVTPTSAQFDSTNWDQPRTVTLSGREDADTEHEQLDVTITSSVGDATVDVTVMDNDQLSIVVAPTGTLQVNEGGNATLAVQLSAQPSGSVVVTVASADGNVAGVSPTSLTFGTSTWDVAQNVVVTGQQDADVANGSTMVTFSATTLQSAVVAVEVVDDDVLGILPSTTNLGTLTEGGTTTFTVRLTQMPGASVTVNVSSSDTTILTATPTPLTFTTANWMTPQTVTVTLPQDVDTADETATISLSATGLTTRTVSASIDDNDTQTIVASPDPVPVDEGGTRALNVRLQFQPSADITLAVTSLNTGVATVSPATLTFTSGNYDTNQQVIVTGPEDADALPGMTAVRLESLPNSLSRDVTVAVTDNDQLLIETSTTAVTVGEAGTVMFGVRLTAMPAAAVTVSVSSGDPTVATVSPASLGFNTTNYGTYQMVTVSGVADVDLTGESLTLTLTAAGLPSKTVDATVTDDDVQAIVVSSATTTVNEGSTGTVNVSLAFMPAADVTVNIASGDTMAATVSPATRTFTPLNYAMPQAITITGVSDADAADDSTTINLTATGVSPSTIMVTVQDDDQLGIQTSATTVDVPEPSTNTFQVRLTAQPPADTVVTVMSSDVTAATVAPAMLTFTTGNYNTFQTVTLTGVSDVDSANDIITVSLMATGMTTRTVNVTVVDDDLQDILLTVTTLPVGEAGSNTFGVRLAAMPASDVVVTVASTDTNRVTAAPSMLTFTSGNYATNQTVTVSGVADLDLANHSIAINLSSPGVTTRSVTANVTDDDTQVVETSATGTINLTEGAAGAAVGFRLRYEPASSTTVTLNPGTGLSVAGGNTLTFLPGNYNTFQNKTISAVQDPDAADITTTVTASAPSATSATVNVFVDDDDSLTLEVSTLSLPITEGATGQFGVRLTAQPPGDTTVTVASNDTNVATITAGASLTFNTTNWNTYQNVTVSGVQDPDVQTEGTNVTVSSAGLATRSVGVTVNDDDVITIVPTVSSLTLNEGGTASMGVRLSHQPSGTVTVNVASSAPAVLVVSAGSTTLSFDATNYTTNQNVTVSAPQDADSDDGSADVAMTAPGITPVAVPATVYDDDIVISDVSPQMGPAAGGTSVNVIGGGFSGPITASMNGNAVSNLQIGSSQELVFDTPAKSPLTGNWSDIRVTKGPISTAVPRAFYYGAWTKSMDGMYGGSATALAAPAGTNLVYAAVETTFYRSTDGGATWTIGGAGLVNNYAMNHMVVSPTDSNRIYISENGLYTSADGGLNFTRVGTHDQIGCLGINPASASTLLMCSGGRLYRSTDSGANWTVVLDPIPTFGLHSPSWSPSGTTVWLSTGSAIFRSLDGGVTWANRTGNLPTQTKYEVIGHPTINDTAWMGQYPSFYKTTNGGSTWSSAGVSTYPTRLAINPTSPLILYGTTPNGVYKTTDGGITWSLASTGIPTRAHSFRDIVLRGSTNELYTGSQGAGVHRSTNAAASWSFSSTGITESTVTTIAPHPTAAGTVWAVHDGGLVRSTDHGATWAAMGTGLPTNAYNFGEIEYMPGTPSTMYIGVPNYGVYKSTDSGATWAITGLATNSQVGSMLVDPANPQHLYVCVANEGVYQSTNAGQTFASINDGLYPDLNVNNLVLINGTLFVTENVGGMYRFTDPTWTPSGSGLPNTGLFFAWTDPSGGVGYVANFNDTYRTVDTGQTWTLYKAGYNGMVWDPQRPQTIYMYRAYSGVERSLTSGASLVPFGLGLAGQDGFGRMAINRDGSSVYLAPGGRRFYRVTN